MNKKGTVFDLIPYIIILFASAIIIFVMYYLLKRFLLAGTMFDTYYFMKGLEALRVFNYAFLFVMVGIAIVMIMLAYSLRTSPAFYIFSFISLIVLILVAVLISNTFWKFVTTSPFSSIASDFPIIVTIMRDLPKIIGIMGFLIMIVLYAKPGQV